ncbi:MAG: hypothetical protein LC624_00835 [Halobacteriales archaeon]|nr:hypothetical protein [Halobacteriales archaeon]
MVRGVRAGAALLLLLPLGPAGAAQAGSGGDTGVNGDDWDVNITAAYMLPNGTPVVLRATWNVWQPWPVPYAGYGDRVTQVTVRVDEAARSDATVTFWLLGAAPSLVFNVTLAADGVAWSVAWTWTEQNGCMLNKVVGPVEARWGTLDGQRLLPPSTASAKVGIGLAAKHGPGGDRQWECWDGTPL